MGSVDGDTLLLAGGELAGSMAFSAGQADVEECALDRGPAGGCPANHKGSPTFCAAMNIPPIRAGCAP